MRQLVARMGFFGHFVCTPSPSAAGFDAADNGLPSWVNVHVFDADNLLTTFAALAVQRR